MTLRPCRQCGQSERRGDHAQLCERCYRANREAHYRLDAQDLTPAQIDARFRAALKRIKRKGLAR